MPTQTIQSTPSRLDIEDLALSYQQHTILRNLSFRAQGGELIGLIGPNGAGKSTLLRSIAGIIAPTQGRILLNQKSISQFTQRERAQHIALVPQSPRLPESFRAAEVVLMGRNPHLPRFSGERPRDYCIAQKAMQRTATWQFANRPIGSLSGGEQQRVILARALAQEPQVLLLDEPTAHLDLKYQIATLRLARQLAQDGLLVIIALHDLNLAAQYVDRLALISGELLAYDTPDRVLTPQNIHRAYDVSAIVAAHPISGTPMISIHDPLQSEGIERIQ
jgi:iron complex transport system ATP-binding protein